MQRHKLLLSALILSAFQQLSAQAPKDELLFGVAYYDEYMPYERLDKDVEMMKAAGINVVRIAESTWSTEEPSDGVFDFHHIDRVLNAMHKAGIKVIIGTPTYAVPAWLVKKYPDVLATTPSGVRNQYGTRQNMDITNEHYRFHAERIIRKIMDHVKDHPAVIGYQVDNETKPYNTSGENVQRQFVAYMKAKFKTLDAINKAFGLDYWSNRINSWEEFPSMNGTINASLKAEFQKFQRQLVTDFLAWQAAIVREYKKPEQFVTQNFDLDWRGHSYGIQTEVDHFAAAKAMDIAGIDIYHPSQSELTGAEISLGGDLTRSMKNKNYFVLETEAQGFAQWTPYPNQLRLQAFSHLASGANMLEYWHWHSIHNSAETYWKGLLSHDFEPNATYNEAKTIGRDFKKIGSKLINLKKENKVAILFSNEALSAFNAFNFGWYSKETYNDILRPYYDALYLKNVGVDFIDPTSDKIDQYKLIIVPALYAAPDALLQKLNAFAKNGGHVLYTFKSGFSDENVKVRTSVQPGIITEAAGVSYNQFVTPKNVTLQGDPFGVDGKEDVKLFMELLTPTTAKVLAKYEHPEWNQYAAVTRNDFGKGKVTYVGFMPGKELLQSIVDNTVKEAGLWGSDQELEFPIITKFGKNSKGKTIRYYFNYSGESKTIKYAHKSGTELLSGKKIKKDENVFLEKWGFVIIEEE